MKELENLHKLVKNTSEMLAESQKLINEQFAKLSIEAKNDNRSMIFLDEMKKLSKINIDNPKEIIANFEKMQELKKTLINSYAN